MGGAAAPLAELLRALAPPLESLAADDFRRLDQTRLPLPALTDRVRHARASEPPGAAAPLAELERILAALGEGAAREREPLLRRAHALLPALREAASTPSAWTEYHATQGRVGAALTALGQSVQVVRAVGPKRAADLARFRLATVEDLLYHLPFRYDDRRALRPLASLAVGEEATAVGDVSRVHETRAGRRGRHVLEVVLRDAEGLLVLVWFHQIPYFSRRLREGQRLVVHGRVEPPLGGGPRRMIHPEIEDVGTDQVLPRIVPIYEKPTEMHPGAMRRIVHAAVEEFADRVPSALPPAVAARQRVLDLP